MASSKPRLLDLFCGAGGAAMGYSRAGFEVVGVDIKPQPRYPFEFVQEDALDYVREFMHWGEPFDAIHASPPCQRWSSKTSDPEAHPDLITPLRPLLEATGLPYVIENVPGSPLENPVTLCGSMFGLGVRRHRWFEVKHGSPVLILPTYCAHNQPKRYRLYDHGKHYMSSVVHVFGTGGGKGREYWPEAMGIDWMTDYELTQAIPPAYTELIGHQLMSHLKARAVA